jgi:hypothetical protein
MALVSLKTNLKSLRYGKDRVGGGSSNQPYIKSEIPDNSSSLDRSGGIDFLLRGGTLAPSRAIQDVSRLTKMFFDFKSPNGVLFAAKQNVLSLTGVKTQASGIINEGIYLPTSTVLQAAGNAFGTHLNKQGLNPFRNTSPSEGFIGGLFEFTGPLGLPTYAQTVKSNQEKADNRLVQLANWKLDINVNPSTSSPASGNINELALANSTAPLGGAVPTTFQNPIPSLTTLLRTKRSPLISTQADEILQYAGGPNSLLGIGKTTIRRPLDNYTNVGLTSEYFKGQYFVLNSTQISNIPPSKENTNVIDFRRELIDQQESSTTGKKNILSKSLDYSNYNNRIEGRVKLGDPGRRNKNVTDYVSGLRGSDGQLLGALDGITSYPLYKSKSSKGLDEVNDLVKFRIGILDNTNPSEKVYIHFRAFLDSMDDQYNAEWNAFKYMGRGENFYRYNGFTRTINLSWTVAAQSKEELMPMYQKLNFLASSLAPDFSSNGYMRGNLATLTVGGYLYEQPGIITSINYGVPTESPWEISIGNGGANDGEFGLDPNVKELPHIIKVTGFQFIPIHNFVPNKQKNEYNTVDKKVESFGAQRYIALQSQTGDNYEIDGLRPGSIIIEPTEQLLNLTAEEQNMLSQ